MQNKGSKISFRGRDLFRILEAFLVEDELCAYQEAYTGVSYTWYPETEFCYVRNKKAFFAAKGGYNDESHNHNDAGSFSLWVNNMPVIIDAELVLTQDRRLVVKDTRFGLCKVIIIICR